MASRKTSELEHGVPSDEDYIDYVDVSETVLALKDKTVLISTLRTLVGGSGSEGGVYTNLNPTPDQTGHIEAGTSFDGVAHNDMWDMLLYSLMASFSAQNTPRRLGSTNAVVLNWSVTRAGDPITEIIVAGQAITETGDSQSGTVSTLATQNVNTTFTMSVTDGANIVNKTAIVTWLNDRFRGALNVVGSGAVANTIADFVGSPPTDAQLKALLTAELSATRVQTLNGFDAAGNFPALLWPTAFGEPTFLANGLVTTAWTKVRSASAFTNSAGYTANYDLWMGNTRQFSPFNLGVQ
jgi:hypothetical protein